MDARTVCRLCPEDRAENLAGSEVVLAKIARDSHCSVLSPTPPQIIPSDRAKQKQKNHMTRVGFELKNTISECS